MGCEVQSNYRHLPSGLRLVNPTSARSKLGAQLKEEPETVNPSLVPTTVAWRWSAMSSSASSETAPDPSKACGARNGVRTLEEALNGALHAARGRQLKTKATRCLETGCGGAPWVEPGVKCRTKKQCSRAARSVLRRRPRSA